MGKHHDMSEPGWRDGLRPDTIERCHVPWCDEAAHTGGLCHLHDVESRIAEGDVLSTRDIQVATEYPPVQRPPDLSNCRAKPGGDSYAQAALRGLLEDARTSHDGRNVTLSRIGFRVGQLIAQGHLYYQTGADFCEGLGESMGLSHHEVNYVLFRKSGALTKGFASV